MRFEPMAIGFLTYGGFTIGSKVIVNRIHWLILIISAIVAYLFPSPYMTPIVIALGGLATALKFRNLQKIKKTPIRIKWANFILMAERIES